jgi:hypothetical protein
MSMKFSPIPPISAAIFLILILLIGYYVVFPQKERVPQDGQTLFSPLGALSRNEAEGDIFFQSPQVLPPGYVLYTNLRTEFSFGHPSTLKIREVDEGGGAFSVILEDITSAQGVQVFVVPYAERSISEERFLKDVPSGVRKNVMPTRVAGVEAVSFDSEHALLGPTKEVWFIYKGYLYEVAVPASSHELLSRVLSTWRF